MIDYVLTTEYSPQDKLLFFFARSDDQSSVTAETILRSFARQAFEHVEVLDEMTASWNDTQSLLSMKLSDVVWFLKNRIEVQRRTYIILDGLDECEKKERRIILDALSTLASAGLGAKVFVASRDTVSSDVKKAFSSFEHVTMGCLSARSDIVAFVENEVNDRLENEDLVVGDQSLVDDIKKALVEHADGM